VVGAATLLLACRIAGTNVGAVFSVRDLYWWLALASLPFLAVCYSLGKTRWGAFLGIRHFPSYPPTWTAVLAGLTSAAAAVAWSANLERPLASAEHIARGFAFTSPSLSLQTP
jgi:hypothetical protein